MNYKIFVDDSSGEFGSDDCQFLAISSEWVSIPTKELDRSKLILLKKKMQKKNINNTIHEPILSIEINTSVHVESDLSNNCKAKKKRRRRRKKNKSLVVGKPTLDVEIIDGIFIQNAAPVLAMEYETFITIPSLSLHRGVVGDQQHTPSNGSIYQSDDK